MRLTSAAGVVALALLGTVILLMRLRDPARKSEPKQGLPSTNEPSTQAAPVSQAAQAEAPYLGSAAATSDSRLPPTSSAQGEASIMARLHELGETDPALSLELAREGNARYLQGPGAAERGWVICKSLTNLERFDEAREEAKKVVKQFPGTSWAMDVTAHILIHPGTHPSERGSGKKYELQ